MYESKESVQDLLKQIEHMIDVPFDKLSKDVQRYQYGNEYINEENLTEEPYNGNPIEEQYNENYLEEQYTEEPMDEQYEQYLHSSPTTPNNEYSFERPVLIESDSDEVEEVTTPDQYHAVMLACYRCNRLVPSDNSLLNPSNFTCEECSKKKRSRSKSFTLDGSNVFSAVADKLKQSFGSTKSQLLSPSAVTNRRKSMDQIFSNSNNNNNDNTLSPIPSRPNSRASSFIEDVKQFLSPLSRKSSRNSLFQDYQQEPKRKTSHSSLLDAINICKPTKHKQERSTYSVSPKQSEWLQEDNEVMGINYRNQPYPISEEQLQIQNNAYIPLRRKQIRQVESREQRMHIYNNAFLECMDAPTQLIPWIIKQTQKGPPDAWFDYTPRPREPKKILGLFKVKSKPSKDLRAQQQQLGDELLNRSTPLLHHRFSNSNLSISPSLINDQQQSSEYLDSSGVDQTYEYDPNCLDYDHQQEEQEEQAEEEEMEPFEKPHTTSEPPRPTTTTPVSILKKTKSTRQLSHYHHNDPHVVEYDDEEIEQEHVPEYFEHYEERPYKPNEYYYGRPNDSYEMRAPRGHRPRYEPPPYQMRKRSMEFKRREEEDYYYRAPRRPPSRQYYDDYERPPSRLYYDDYEEYDRVPQRKNRSRRNSGASRYEDERRRPSYHYYDEWEAALDALCELFPRLDRPYVHEFLESAHGDYAVAKNMIMDMIIGN